MSPANLAFGNQALGTTSAAQKVTLKNGQTTAITVNSISSNLSDYSQTNNCPASPATLGAGKSCLISVTFAPAAVGSRPATLTIQDTGTNSPQTVALSGSGVVAVGINPTSLAFGNQPVGLKSAAMTVTLTNNQNKTLTITKITENLADFTHTTSCPMTPKTLGAGASCTISEFFTPSTTGLRSGTLTVSDNASNSPTISLTGTGIIPVVVTPSNLTFSSQALGTSSAPQTVTLTNNQSTNLTITSVSSSADFPTSSTCPISPAILAPGASCTASVSFQPKVTGARSGTLTFKDSANNSPQTVALSGTGTAATLVSVAVTPNSSTIPLGKMQQYVATGTYTDGSTKNLTTSATWQSSITSVATINAAGLASSRGQGTTTITATSGGKSGTATLMVTAAALVSIAVTPSTASIPAGTTQQFTATGTYTNGATKNLSASVAWGTSAPSVAAVSGSGLAQGIAMGSAGITATSGSISGSANLTVTAPALVSIAVAPANPSFALGTTQALKATGTYTDGGTLDLTTTVTWSTANSGIATVSSQGVASSAAIGSTTVTALSGAVSGSTTLQVTPATLVSLAVTPAIPTIPLGTTLQFSVTGTFTDGTTQVMTQSVQWSSDTPGVANVSNAVNTRGLATSISTGSATITAASGGITGSTTLTVTSAVLASIAVTPASPVAALGTTQQFTATGTFTDGSVQDLTVTATWASDTPGVATVDKNGLARAVGIGSAGISATSGSAAGTVTLTVTAAQLVSLAINPTGAAVPVGVPQQFMAIGTYTDGSTQDLTQGVRWSSSEPATATISNSTDSAGLATTIAVGATTIGAASGSIATSAQLTVNPAALVSIEINPPAPTIPLGTTQQFSATGTYTDGSTMDLTSVVTWSTSSAIVAVISNATGSNGLATSSGVGTANITAASGTVLNSTTLTVGGPALVSVAISPLNSSIPLGGTQQFTVTGTYTDGSTQDLTSSAAWTSDVPGIASIDQTGFATSVSMGVANITATSGSSSASTPITVSAPVLVFIAVQPASVPLPAGTAQQFTATGIYTDGSTRTLTNVAAWRSSDSTIATVSSSGLAQTLAQGAATITANLGAKSGAQTLTVTAPVLVSIAVSPATASVPAGNDLQFTATGTYTDNSTQDLTGSVTWSAAPNNIASVNASGNASGLTIGSATLTATLNSITGSASLNVAQPVLVSLSLAPANPSFALGTQQPLTATGTYSDGSTQDLTAQATWATGNPTIATVDNQGDVSGVALGNGSITATVGSVHASTAVTVSPATLVSIAVTPAIPTIALGITQQFAATGTFTDGSVQDVTQTVEWSSDSQGIATISNAANKNGLATSAGAGTATITVTSGSISSSTTLTVTPAVLVSMAVTPPAPSIALGTAQQFTATGTFTDGSTVDLSSSVTWSSAMTGTATINPTGFAMSQQPGDTVITATSGNISNSTDLTVTQAQIVTIAITPESISIPLGLTQQLTAVATYTDGTTQDITLSAHWTSTESDVATISNTQGSQGLATALGIGTTSIEIDSGSVSGFATLMVNPATLSAIAITPSAPAIALGTSQQFTATGTYTDGSHEDVTSIVTWGTSSAQVAIISNATSSDGLATSASTGSVTITATSGGISSSATLTVNQATQTNISVTPSGTSLAAGFNQQFTAMATYSDGSTQDVTQSATWSSSMPGVASITADGLVTAIFSGSAQITATSDAASGSTALTVTPAVPVALTVTPSNLSIYETSTQQFLATLTYSDGTAADVSGSVNWSSLAPGVATINSSGLATGVSTGTAVLQATWGGNVITATTSLMVLGPIVTATPSSSSVAIGGSQQFSATVTGSANQTVIWSVDGVAGGSAAAGIGTISASGVYTASFMIGVHTITATAQVNSSSTASSTVKVGSVIPVANTFFGMHLHTFNVPIPSSMEGAARVWDSNSAQWPYLNTANGTYSWANLDTLLANYKTAGINDVLYTLWRVPKWASSQPSDVNCDYANLGTAFTGECDPPSDLNPDGTGTNLIWRSWVQNIAQHVNSASYLQTHAKISYWEPCNECFRSPILDPGFVGTGGHTAYNGTYPQLIRMMQDARCIIVGNANDPITAMNTTCGHSGYPFIGIDPTAKMVMPDTSVPQPGGKIPPYPQVAQNLLYCTCSGNSCAKNTAGCPTGSAGSKAVDIISLHLYLGNLSPEQIPAQIANVRSYLQSVDLAKDLWDDEGGWGQNTNAQLSSGDPDMEAAWLARYHIMSWAAGLQRNYWYEWDNTVYGTLWSPTNTNACATPFGAGFICAPGIAYQQVHDWLLGSTIISCSASGSVWSCGLTKSDGTAAQIVWDTSKSCANGSCTTSPYQMPPAFSRYEDLTGKITGAGTTAPVGIKPILLLP